MFGPAAVGDRPMTGSREGPEVAEPGLARRPSVVHGHIPFGVIKIHVLAETGPEGEDVGDLAGSDRGPQPRRDLIAVDRGDLGGI